MQNRAASRLPLVFLALLGVAAVPALATESSTPQAVVERLHGALLDVMKRADALGYDGRRARLEPVIDASFDLPFMARITLGRTWKKLDEEQHARWIAIFQELSLATYAARFDDFSGEFFESDGEEAAAHDTVLVKTRLVIPDKDPVALHYRLRRNGEDWRIIDIYMNGTVSELALRRSEYTVVLEREGFDSLVEALRKKIAAYAAGEDADS
jgi:phospholipid transport system substrate-binding protein